MCRAPARGSANTGHRVMLNFYGGDVRASFYLAEYCFEMVPQLLHILILHVRERLTRLGIHSQLDAVRRVCMCFVWWILPSLWLVHNQFLNQFGDPGI